MSERDELVCGLYAEVLGPRHGVGEVLAADEDPLDEYIAGVLAPRLGSVPEPDSDEELVGDHESGPEDQTDPGPEVSAAAVNRGVPAASSLDPRSRPAS